MNSPLIIRADASAEIGTGHVMRCLALAQAWEEREERAEDRNLKPEGTEQPSDHRLPTADHPASQGFAAARRPPTSVLFICAELPDALEERLLREGCSVHRINATPGSPEDIAVTLHVARDYSRPTTDHRPPTTDNWFVTDGYAFDLAYQRRIRAAGFKLLVVDDYNHLPEYECDVLLNQNLGAEQYEYRVNADARRLMGPKYALLRREFRAVRSSNDWKSDAESVPTIGKNILVTMGGADTHGMTEKVLDAISRDPGKPLHVKAVVGAANSSIEHLRRNLPAGPHRFELLANVEDMPGLMRWADLAVTAAGSTCWELMALGVPMMVVVLAENQERIASELNARGYALNLGWYAEWEAETFLHEFALLRSDAARRARFAASARDVVDGRGASRVSGCMRAFSMRFRPATADDPRLLWTWANDPATRSASFVSAPIPWEDHVDWFERRLADERGRLYIAEMDDDAIGSVRVEEGDDGAWTISITLAPRMRGLGLAGRLIDLGTRRCAADLACGLIHAFIKPSNSSSCRAFESAGYTFDTHATVRNQPALRYAWRQDWA